MPKLLVLYYGAESPSVALAEAAAAGAKQVRFAEVDLCSGGAHEASSGRRHKQLDSVDAVPRYDGVVFACPTVGEVPSDAAALFDALEQASKDAFANMVFGVIGGENTTLFGRVARLGGIIVAEPRGLADPEARARALGARVGKVVGWVWHALSHEAHDHQH